jgi:hypothetical protein
MRNRHFSILHPLWPAVILLAGLLVVLSITSAHALPNEPESATEVPGGIQGHLYTPLGTTPAPVAGGWIDVVDEFGQPWMGSATDDLGYFEIPNLPPGHYVLRAYPPAGNPHAASLPTVVEVTSGAWETVDLHLTEVRVSGWVRDAQSGTRIEGADVLLHNQDWSLELWDRTNANGEFKFGGVTVGMTYTLELFPPPETEYQPVSGPTHVVPVSTSVVLEMFIPPTNVVGIVHDPAGNPVPEAGVFIARDDDWRETSTGELGEFLFRGLEPGIYWVQAVPPWGPNGEGLVSSPPFTISLSQPDSLVDVGIITLPKAIKTVTGQILRAGSSDPITQALVAAHRLDMPGYVDQPVSHNGTFTLGLPGGEWHLTAEPLPPPAAPADWIFAGPPTWIAFEQPISVTESITGIELEVISTNAAVTGRVVCPGGVPCDSVPGAPEHWQIWVELRNQDIKNGTGLGLDYEFGIPIPDGWYELVVHVDHPFVQGPAPQPVFVGPNHILDIGDVQLLHKDAFIVGQVRNELGQGISGVPVVGWQPDSFGWGWAETNASGYYTMPVVPGEWFVEPQPLPEMPYVFRHEAKLVRVAHGGTMRADFALTTANARIKGIAVDAHHPELGRLWGLEGWAFALRELPLRDFEFFSDAPLTDGGFELKAQGGFTYAVGLHLPPQAPYVSGAAGPVRVPVGAEVPISVPLEHKDARITGNLINVTTGQPASGPIWAKVFGEDERGHWGVVQVDPHSAEYQMSVVSGTWHLHPWVDPASGYVAVPTETIATVSSGGVTMQNLPVWPIAATISGQVLQPNGQPLSQTFVFAEGESPFVGYFEAHAKTDDQGNFELQVPDGEYFVGAGLPRHELEQKGWFNPRPIRGLRVTATSPATGLQLQFRKADARITGVLSFAPGVNVTATHPAYVWSWSETGEWAETEAQLISGTNTFSYTLRVISGTVWHIGAVYDDPENGLYYESRRVQADLRATDHVQRNLRLLGPFSMPQPFIITFDGSQMQTIMMPDGVELSIPAGSIVTSGNVTLFIFPTKELHPEQDREVIGVGYEMWAVDEDGQEITQFNQNIQMSFPYPADAVLEAQGIVESLLVPVYYSTLVERWILANSYLVDTANNEIIMQIDHFTKFGALSRASQHQVFLPLMLK